MMVEVMATEGGSGHGVSPGAASASSERRQLRRRGASSIAAAFGSGARAKCGCDEMLGRESAPAPPRAQCFGGDERRPPRPL